MEYPQHSSRIPALDPEVAGKCVLIVEDNPLNMKLFSAVIAAQGHHVLQATDGSRGLDLAHQEHPDLIIMDVELPGMSGLDVTHSLKTDDDTRDIPIIVTTGYGLNGNEAEVRASGCDGFMAKPIAISEFLELIELFMRRSTRAVGYAG
jgi:two-component system cell cycle response regulator DivK